MTATNVARSVRARFGPTLAGASLALIVLSVGLLLANPQIDVPLPPDDSGLLHGAPRPVFFGLTHLTPNEVARLHFANPVVPGTDPNRPAVVRLEFVDSGGRILLRGEPQVVEPGQMTSLDLVADGLAFPAGSNRIGVRGLVTFFNPQARGITSVQIEDVTSDSPAVLLHPLAGSRSPYIIRELRPLCTSVLSLRSDSELRINVVNAGDRGFPGAQLHADIVIYAMGPQRVLVRKTVRLDPMQSDSLVFQAVGQQDLFGTVEFIDTPSSEVAFGSYEYRGVRGDGSLQAHSMGSCPGPWPGTSTSGGGPTNSGGA